MKLEALLPRSESPAVELYPEVSESSWHHTQFFELRFISIYLRLDILSGILPWDFPAKIFCADISPCMIRAPPFTFFQYNHYDNIRRRVVISKLLSMQAILCCISGWSKVFFPRADNSFSVGSKGQENPSGTIF
jgi:hypothetical protein